MENAVRELKPSPLWSHFADLNAVPRASKKEERVIQFIVDFAKKLDLEYLVDDIGNVIVKKPATAGMENRQTIVLQSHLDMVHQKNNDTVFDFDTEGIKMLVEDDWVKADGTTLGADNGIGVATIMAVLSSVGGGIVHPAIEALFTIDEETGMTGALGLKGGLLSGSILLNLDTEDDDELTIGCAGGIDVTATGYLPRIHTPVENPSAFKITVKGLTGGHSGMDIHKGRGNANKLINRLLLEASKKLDLHVVSIDGGGLRNAIPRESVVVVQMDRKFKQIFQDFIKSFEAQLRAEHISTDADFDVTVVDHLPNGTIISPRFLHGLLRSIYACPNGIYRMSPEIEGMVQTSNNLARVHAEGNRFTVMCLTRSSVDSEKFDLVNAISSCFELIGAKVETSGSYPGWTPKPEADIIKLMSKIYKEKYNEDPHVYACHAGLECGILGTNYPNMDMISFGPNIRGAHSPDEKVQISSVQKFWKYFLNVLERIPEKN